jgi:2-iminobutanoate/2-iminopropanoate deaminase
LIVKRP